MSLHHIKCCFLHSDASTILRPEGVLQKRDGGDTEESIHHLMAAVNDKLENRKPITNPLSQPGSNCESSTPVLEVLLTCSHALSIMQLLLAVNVTRCIHDFYMREQLNV